MPKKHMTVMKKQRTLRGGIELSNPETSLRSEKNINKLHAGGKKKKEDMQTQAKKKKGSQETRIHEK